MEVGNHDHCCTLNITCSCVVPVSHNAFSPWRKCADNSHTIQEPKLEPLSFTRWRCILVFKTTIFPFGDLNMARCVTVRAYPTAGSLNHMVRSPDTDSISLKLLSCYSKYSTRWTGNLMYFIFFVLPCPLEKCWAIPTRKKDKTAFFHNIFHLSLIHIIDFILHRVTNYFLYILLN